LPGRHVAPRHKASRSISKSMGRLAGDAASLLPASGLTGAAALVGAAGVAVGLGVVTADPGSDTREASVDLSGVSATNDVSGALADRSSHQSETSRSVSRSVSRPALVKVQRATKQGALPVAKQDVSGAVTETVEATDPRDIAMGLLADYGWSSDQFSCLDELYQHESGWNPTAANPYSGAYGIPQALPGSKMAEYGSDWQSNPETQLKWGLAYIQDRYGSPCGAWSFWTSNNWY
jgi:Transglycosylase SLT domain